MMDDCACGRRRSAVREGRRCALGNKQIPKVKTFVTKLGCYHRCMPSLRSLVLSLVLLSVLWAGTARAEAPPPERVGRIAAAAGGVTLRPAGGEWADSRLNEPVAAGMSLRTSPGGRATLGIGAMMITLSGGGELDLARLDDGILQIALRQGRIGVHVARLDPGESV